MDYPDDGCVDVSVSKSTDKFYLMYSCYLFSVGLASVAVYGHQPQCVSCKRDTVISYLYRTREDSLRF